MKFEPSVFFKASKYKSATLPEEQDFLSSQQCLPLHPIFLELLSQKSLPVRTDVIQVFPFYSHKK